MPKFSAQTRLQNYNDLKSYIIEKSEKENHYPTTQEMVNFSHLAERTIRKYKHKILNDIKQTLDKKYNDDVLIRVESVLRTLDKNKIIFEKIRDNNLNQISDIINAADNVVHCDINAIHIMEKGLEFTRNNNDNSTKEESIYRQVESEKIREGIESISD